MELEGDFNFENIALDPPGCRVLVHQEPSQWPSWSPHALDGWYTGPSMESYQYKVYIHTTQSERITDDTVQFLPHNCNAPNLTSVQLAILAENYLTAALQKPMGHTNDQNSGLQTL